MVNPGGPGASAVDTVAGMGAALAGTDIAAASTWSASTRAGSDTPRPNCAAAPTPNSTPTGGNRYADYSPAGVAHIEALYRQFAQNCAQRVGTEFLANVGTASAATDMDVVRAALGENQINYLGFSYGTEIGAAYADGYPDTVRAMVLDGAIDPSLGPDRRELHQMAGFQTAFDDYAADCAQSAGCPLGTDPTQFVDRYHQLVDPLVTRPAQTSDPRGLSYQDAITGTVNALYSRQYWKFLTSGLLGLQRGTDPGDLLLLADDYLDRDPSRPLPELAGRVLRHPLCRRAVSRPTRRCGPTADQRSRRGRAVPQLRVLHRFCSP